LLCDPTNSRSDYLAARVAVLHERAELSASHVLAGTNAVDKHTTVKADLTYAIASTITTTGQYFETSGTKDPVRWTSTGNVDSRGWIAQLDYVPWGKPGSPSNAINLRLTAQYTAYEEFNGQTQNASDRNTFLVGLAIIGTTSQ
jgi:hypothetical protein